MATDLRRLLNIAVTLVLVALLMALSYSQGFNAGRHDVAQLGKPQRGEPKQGLVDSPVKRTLRGKRTRKPPKTTEAPTADAGSSSTSGDDTTTAAAKADGSDATEDPASPVGEETTTAAPAAAGSDSGEGNAEGIDADTLKDGLARMTTDDIDEVKKHDFANAVYESLMKAVKEPAASDIVPVMVIPLFHDGDELKSLLRTITVGVRLFAFSWNSNSASVKSAIDVVRRIPVGVVINHTPENIGFSGAVNAGVRAGMKLTNPPARWFFIVNADSSFPRDALSRFARQVNALDDTYGLAYGPRQDHFAFVIMRAAVNKVGYFDEVFWPGYMEDIDYRWRVHIAGLQQKITQVTFLHKRSSNERKPRSVTGEYMNQLVRASKGWEYGWMKWGKYGTQHIERAVPPSGWRTPFNIKGAPLGLWAVDPAHRSCIRTGKGQYHIKSSTCWYNGTYLYAKLPPGTQLSKNLIVPGPTGR